MLFSLLVVAFAAPWDTTREAERQCTALERDPQVCAADLHIYPVYGGPSFDVASDEEIARVRKECEGGRNEACVVLANAAGWVVDPQVTLDAAIRSCAAGLPHGCAAIDGVLLSMGATAVPDAVTAMFDAQCQVANAVACNAQKSLAEERKARSARLACAQRGECEDAERVNQAAERSSLVACDAGDAGACFDLGSWLSVDTPGLVQNDAKALKRLLQSCELGHIVGCGAVLDRPALSRGDLERLLRLLEGHWSSGFVEALPIRKRAQKMLKASTQVEACAAGDTRACIETAERNKDEAALEEACTSGAQAACTVVGTGLLGSDPDTAAALFTNACDGDEGRACMVLGLPRDGGPPDIARLEQSCDLEYGEGCLRRAQVAGEADLDTALRFARRACALGETQGCNLYGVAAKGTDASDDDQGALEAVVASCERGEATSCGLAADLTDDRRLSTGHAGTACDLGQMRDCVRAGRGYRELRNIGAAYHYLKRGCDLGDPAACGELGTLGSADGLSISDFQAYDLFTRACRRGQVRACARQGEALVDGLGVAQDRDAGRSLLDTACPEDGYACGVLGRMQDEASRPDPKKGTALYEKGCGLGSASVCTAYGLRLKAGVGAAVDLAGAAKAFDEACDGGSPEGCGELGVLLKKGLGVAKDKARSKALIEAACLDGADRFCR